MKPPLIGVMGKKRSGKDTFASFLVDGYGYKRVAFADPLKEALLKVDPIIAERVPGVDYGPEIRLSREVERIGWEEAKEIPEVRRLLQSYGVTIRSYQPDFWLNLALAQAHVEWLQGNPVVITDVRFPNEADAIKKAGGLLVRVVRPGLASDDTHESETALDDYIHDLLIPNDRDLNWLKKLAGIAHAYPPPPR